MTRSIRKHPACVTLPDICTSFVLMHVCKVELSEQASFVFRRLQADSPA